MKAKTKINKIDPLNTQNDCIAKAAQTVINGGHVIFPTRCLYGLGADAFNGEAVEKIFRIKKRKKDKPILLLIKNSKEIYKLTTNISTDALKLIKGFWPGKITLLFKASKNVPLNLTAGTGKIGIRIPGHPVALKLVQAVNNPLTGTSANFSGEKGCPDIAKLNKKFIQKIDRILDAGPLEGGNGSTIIDVSGNIPIILREGTISTRRIMKVLEK